ncbi:putative glucose transporter [Trypanosoma rangeli]|uniref:Putative glucose transporter n=1 Tax=Trypanosoma rangeli TaxID=5698 RepID=A0A3R7KPU3_TRYRA|nr:putative glucose transporter [Trypanosoma rangeli]RNF11189.1 putative glucose transporter [Trypanosoma rangeli]|eukprot:RNF11189.1 putative glucose transporter [Trypanosoma rangeli]
MEHPIIKRRTPPVHEEQGEGLFFKQKWRTASPLSSAVPFFSWEILQIVLIHCIAGVFFGYNIGFVGPYYTFVRIRHDCSLNTGDNACASFNFGQCVWHNGNCEFAKSACTDLMQAECNSGVPQKQIQCHWNLKVGECEPLVGYTAAESGVFAASMIVGGCLGSLGAGFLLTAAGRTRTFLIYGIVACLTAVITHVSTYTEQYLMVIIGRVLAGVVSGILCVASPMYVEEITPVCHRQLVGVFFQVACTFGILLAAAAGLVLNPGDFSTDVHMQARHQGLCVLNSLFSGLLVIVGLLMRESPTWVEQMIQQRGVREERNSIGASLRGKVEDTDEAWEGTNEANTVRPSWSVLAQIVFAAFMLCIAQQMTGINAIMNYAPTITGALGFAPLAGNVLVMAWNFLSVLVSIPLSFKYRADHTFNIALCFASASCLLTGITLLPAVGASVTVKRLLSGFGIALFILCFEVGMGSFFWTLSQGIFPPSFRARGSSLTVLFQFVLNALMNLGFPVAVEKISGGPSGDQEKGMGVVFIVFGGMGFASAACLLKYLRLWDLE